MFSISICTYFSAADPWPKTACTAETERAAQTILNPQLEQKVTAKSDSHGQSVWDTIWACIETPAWAAGLALVWFAETIY